MQSNATYRDGQRGHLGAPCPNGFALFTSETGAVFTVHADEVKRDGGIIGSLYAADDRTCYSWRFERKDGILQSVARVPTRPGQSSAKHAARVDAAMREERA